MTTFDILAAVVGIAGFFAILAGLVLIANAIVRDILDSFNRERATGQPVERLSGRPDYFHEWRS